MPIERDDLATRIYGHNVKGLQFYDWDRVLQQEIYLQEDNTLNIGGEGVAAPSISAGAWLGDDGAGIFSFRPDLPVVVTSTAIVTEYPTIASALSAAVSGETVAIPPGTYDESITLKDGVRIVELFTGTVIIDSVSADKAVITADGGYINVTEIRCTRSRNSDGKLHAVFADHDTGVCTVVAELIRAENTDTVSPGETFGVTMWGAGTLWVFAQRIEAFLDGYQHVFGVASADGTSYVAAVQILADGGTSEDSLVYGVRSSGGEQYIWARVEAQSEGTAWAGYCTFGEQHIWGDCVASGGAVRGAACEGGLQVIHGNAIAESTKGWTAIGAHVQEGTQRVFGSCYAIGTGLCYGIRLLQDSNAGVQEIWGNAIAGGGSAGSGAFLDGSAQAGAVTQRVDGDVSGEDYGARCEEGTQTITGGRASGGTYDLYQTGGTLQIEGVQYDSYSGTITILPSSLNALLLELEDTTELTIAAGVVTITQSYHRVDTQNDDATDDLDTVNGGVTGQILVLRPENDARTVVVKHNTGNIWNPSVADVTLDDVNDHVLLLYDGSKWCLLTYEGTVDHGALDGLADDDHMQYLKEKGSGGLAAEIPEHDHSAAAEGGRVSLGGLGGGKLLWVFDGESLHVHSYPAAWTEVNVDISNYRATTYGAPNVELFVDEYLSVADAAWQESGSEEFLVWGWCYLDSLAGTNTIAAKWTAAGDARSWRLDYGGDDVYFRFIADATGLGGADVITLSSTKGLLLNTWFFVAGYLLPGELMRIFVGRHDETELTVDSLTVDVPAGLHDGAAALCIGATATPTNQHEGRIGRVMARANVASDGINAYVETLFAARRAFYNDVETEYILRARWATWDQGYVDDQVLDTEGEGIQDGTLTVVEDDGTLAVVSGRCAFTAQATPAWGDLGFPSQAITRALGRTLFATIEVDDPTKYCVLCWSDAAHAAFPDNGYTVMMQGSIQQWKYSGRVGGANTCTVELITVVADTDYTIAKVLGGYDANGVPWHEGETPASYLYGCTIFGKGGVWTDWNLLYRDPLDNTATMYATVANNNASGTLGDILVPDVDLSAMLQPLVLDTFTDDNGTGLDAHDPDVDAEGGGWTEYSGVWEINENHARMTSAAGYYTTSIDSGEADVLVRATLRPGAANGLAAIVVRQTDDDNYLDVQIRAQENEVRLLKIEAGGSLVLDSAAVTINADTDYEVTVKCDDETITAWVDGLELVTDSGVAFNKTATRHGLLDYGGRGSLFDDFHIHALRSDTYGHGFGAS